MRKIILIMWFFFPCIALAGGIQVRGQGQKAMSMGGAFTAMDNDASSVFYNPGAMSFGAKSSITLGGSFMSPKTNYLSPYSGNIEADKKLLTTFHLYLNYKINDKLSAGISVNNPFAANTKWADDWEGRYITQQVKFKTTYIQPTVSYMINENIGAGAGLVYALGNMNLRRAIPVEGASPYGEEEFKVTGNKIGFNAGLFIKFNDEMRVGINYRSAVKFDMKDGDASITNIPSSLVELFPSTAKFNLSLKLPAVISAGIAYNFTKKLATTFQVDYISWSSFDSLNFIFPDHPELDTRTGRFFNNTITVRIGGQYSFTDKLDVRIGGAYDETPVPNDYLSPEFPDADKILLAVGVGYKFNDRLSGDVTLGTENYFERKGQLINENFAGSYKTNIFIAGIGLNYNF